MMEPTPAWAVVRDGNVVHIRLKKGVAEACATIEKDVYAWDDIRVVPVLMTEIGDVK
jgi:hypothetical protein